MEAGYAAASCAALAPAAVAVVVGRGVLSALVASSLVLDYREHQSSGRIIVEVKRDNCQIVGPTDEPQVEKVELLPIVASANQSSIEIGCKIIISSNPKLSYNLRAVHIEYALEVDLECIGPGITSRDVDPAGCWDARKVAVVGVVVELLGYDLADWESDGSCGGVGGEDGSLGGDLRDHL